MRTIAQETDRLVVDPHRREVGPIIGQLQRRWHEPKEKELQRLLGKLPALDDRARDEISRSFDRLVDRLLHRPLESLQRESRQGRSGGFQQAVARLFRLKD